jgi:hypothetical protein
MSGVPGLPFFFSGFSATAAGDDALLHGRTGRVGRILDARLLRSR